MADENHARPLVLLVGSTGRTGQSIVKALLRDESFRLAALIRPDSLNKPVALELQAAGVEIRSGDVSTDGVEKLKALLQGVDILILTLLISVEQRDVLRAAKDAGVKRVIPADFGPPAARGVMAMHDKKLDIREFIIGLGLPHTFIEVGWWLQLMLPYSHKMDQKIGNAERRMNNFIADGKKKVAFTMLKNIGEFVVRIISDPRTLNQTVMTWDGEVSLEEAWKMAESLTGEDFSDYPRVTADDVKQRIGPDESSIRWYQYMQSLHVRGDDTVANAVALGALDARELYPDYKAPALEEAVEDFYKNRPIYEAA